MIEGSPLFKSLVVSHGLPHHLYFIIITLVMMNLSRELNEKVHVQYINHEKVPLSSSYVCAQILEKGDLNLKCFGNTYCFVR